MQAPFPQRRMPECAKGCRHRPPGIPFGAATSAGEGAIMNFGSNDTAIIIGLLAMVIFLAAVLWRLHSAVDTISKIRRP
jgi:hypothetical protein